MPKAAGAWPPERPWKRKRRGGERGAAGGGGGGGGMWRGGGRGGGGGGGLGGGGGEVGGAGGVAADELGEELSGEDGDDREQDLCGGHEAVEPFSAEEAEAE